MSGIGGTECEHKIKFKKKMAKDWKYLFEIEKLKRFHQFNTKIGGNGSVI